jgi:hypothetical protein
MDCDVGNKNKDKISIKVRRARVNSSQIGALGEAIDKKKGRERKEGRRKE